MRAATVSLAALALAAGGHLYGGGTPPPPAAFATLWALSAALIWGLSGHRWTARELAGVLILTQAVMHMTCAFAPDAGPSRMGPAMIAGHAVATAASVWALRYGEETVWRLVDALLLRPLLAVVSLGAPSAPRVAGMARTWPESRSWMARLLVANSPTRAPPGTA